MVRSRDHLREKPIKKGLILQQKGVASGNVHEFKRIANDLTQSGRNWGYQGLCQEDFEVLDQTYFKYHPLKFNSSPLKNDVWKTIPFLLGFGFSFSGASCQLNFGSSFPHSQLWKRSERWHKSRRYWLDPPASLEQNGSTVLGRQVSTN